ncbi:peptidylprolyl isomerase [Haloechinothrix salitolerans]|uniref:Peptidylprolyl isomerase n=1 Tax=Haloechinothrix salitolerans TaxID=926830 RepID=A0ABW2BUB4_9PSEU
MNLRSILTGVRNVPHRIRSAQFLQGRRTRTILVLVAVLAVVGGSAGGFYWVHAVSLPKNAALRYNDRVVTVDELDRRVDTLKALYGVQPPDPGDKQKSNAFRRDMAKAIAVSMILDDAAKERGIVIAGKTVRDTLTKFISENIGEGPSARARFVRALGTTGTSEQAVLDEIRRQLVSVSLFEDITQGLSVNDSEVAEAFKNRKKQLGRPERRKILNIVVGTEEEAKAIVSDLRAGSSFEKLARERSLDGATRGDGGNLGLVSAGQLQDEYAETAFNAEPGSIFGPVKAEHGWNVGKVKKVLPPAEASLAEVEEPLRRTLEMERAIERWRSWLGEEIKNADVEYAEGYRPAAPDAPPSHTPGMSPR